MIHNLQLYKEHRSTISTLEFCPVDGENKYIASGSYDKIVLFYKQKTSRKWESTLDGSHPQTLRCKRALDVGFMVSHLAFHNTPHGPILAVAGEKLHIYDLQSWTRIAKLKKPKDPKTGKKKHRIESISATAFSPDGKLLVSAEGRSLLLWDLEGDKAGKLRKKWKAQHTKRKTDGKVVTVAWAPSRTKSGGNGRYIASGSYDRCIRFWDHITYENVATLTGHQQVVNHLVFSKTRQGKRIPGDRIYSASMDTTIKLWNISRVEGADRHRSDDLSHDDYRCMHTFRGHKSEVVQLALSDDEKFLISCSSNILLIEQTEGNYTRIRKLRMNHQSAIKTMRYVGGKLGFNQRDRMWIVSADSRHNISLLDLMSEVKAGMETIKKRGVAPRIKASHENGAKTDVVLLAIQENESVRSAPDSPPNPSPNAPRLDPNESKEPPDETPGRGRGGSYVTQSSVPTKIFADAYRDREDTMVDTQDTEMTQVFGDDEHRVSSGPTDNIAVIHEHGVELEMIGEQSPSRSQVASQY